MGGWGTVTLDQWRGHGGVWGQLPAPPLLPKDGPRDSFKIEEKIAGYRFGKNLSQKWPDEICISPLIRISFL